MTGQPPFDVVMLTPSVLVAQMIELTSVKLPPRWQAKMHAMTDMPNIDENVSLHKWLEEVYFDNDKQAELTVGEIARIAEAIARMLKFEPSLRAAAGEILAEKYFQ